MHVYAHVYTHPHVHIPTCTHTNVYNNVPNSLVHTFVIGSIEVFDLFNLFMFRFHGSSCNPQPPSVGTVPYPSFMAVRGRGRKEERRRRGEREREKREERREKREGEGERERERERKREREREEGEGKQPWLYNHLTTQHLPNRPSANNTYNTTHVPMFVACVSCGWQICQ